MAISFHCLVLSIVVVGILSLCYVGAQAPGDEDAFCLDISTAPAYAPSVKPLLDSWRYQTLLGAGGVWDSLDLDNDTIGVREANTRAYDRVTCIYHGVFHGRSLLLVCARPRMYSFHSF